MLASHVPRPKPELQEADLVSAAVDAMNAVIRCIEERGGALGPALGLLTETRDLLLMQGGFLAEPPSDERF